jgi:phosphatidylglycerol lysyltransferase
MNFFSSERFNYLKENRRLIAQFIFAVLFVSLGVWFFKHEQSELGEVRQVLKASKWLFLMLGISFTIIYILFQGLMYKLAFKTVKDKVRFSTTLLLYLKRNFISIFLPAGSVTSLTFFSNEIQKEGISKSKIYFASSIYAFVGILSVALLAIPIFIYSLVDGLTGTGEWFALAGILSLISILFLVYRSIIQRGYIFKLVIKIFPPIVVYLEDLINHNISIKYLLFTILVSISIDIIGIVHLYIAFKALNFHPSIVIAMLGYLTAVLSMIVSPFMRGLGAVEVTLTYVLTRYGFTNVEAVAITVLYRFFEFWLPLLSGAISFLVRLNKLLMRVVPAVFIFILGIINIVSVLTPAIEKRVGLLQNFLPIDAINASNYFVLLAGIFMLLTATFMIRGLKNAWWIALVLGIISCIGHLTKAIDYEESLIALFVIVMLIYSKKEYYIKGSAQLLNVGIKNSFICITAVLIYGVIGFYYLDKKHFNIDFSIWQSIYYTLDNFFLLRVTDLVPNSAFAKHFLFSINVSGFISLMFFFYTIIKPYVVRKQFENTSFLAAKSILEKFGNSSLDYFKTYSDKILFIQEDIPAFISYKIASNFAVVLEKPVAESHEKIKTCIIKFDEYCYQNGLKSIYYRVPEESIKIFKELKKKSLLIGQEGIVDLNVFKLEGRNQKALRNSINKVTDKGYKANIHEAPLKDGLLQKLKAVSDEWLRDNERHEIAFSQGIFEWNEIKQQTVITVENAEEKIVAFVNMIPDYAKNEATYDLIRKTADAPGGVIDFLLVEFFQYIKSKNIQFVNLGFAPMSGIESPQNLPEKSMKFAYQKINSFVQYKGLREYKEKFSPSWTNKYLIYDHDFDLLQVPLALSKVVKL